MNISIIVGLQNRDRGIGFEGGQPYHSKQDFNRFKELTMGSVCIMGRKTMDDIGRKLPGRECIVVTRNKDYKAPQGVCAVSSYEEAKAKACEFAGKRVFNIGGSSLYKIGITDKDTDRIFVTRYLGHKDCDRYFPRFEMMFEKVFETEKPKKDTDSKTDEEIFFHFEEWVRL